MSKAPPSPFAGLPSVIALPPFQPGWVWLVGAGPGDPALLTLHAAHALAEADVVVHDALVNADVLALARVDAEIILRRQARWQAVGQPARHLGATDHAWRAPVGACCG